MDLKIARYNMVQQQIRPMDVSNPKILNLLESLPREHFVLEPYRQLAYSDTALPIGHHQVTLQPNIVGRMLQFLQLNKRETVLEIGTGTGYFTACLAKLARKVITIDIFPELSQLAAQNLEALDIHNVQFETGDGLLGFPPRAPFDAIVITGALPFLPSTLREQLEEKGRLLAFIGTAPVMSAVLLTKINKERWQEQTLFETMVPALLETPPMDRFKF